MTDGSQSEKWRNQAEGGLHPAPSHGERDRGLPHGEDVSHAAESFGSSSEVDFEDRRDGTLSEASAHRLSRAYRRVPSLVQDSGIWVWLWVIGGLVLVAIIIVAVLALPAKKGIGTTRHSASELALLTTTAPASTCRSVVRSVDRESVNPSSSHC